MINASTFTYDHISCSDYGLTIAGFSDESVEENEVFSPSFSTLYVPRSRRLYHGGVKHDSAPTFTMTVVSKTEISLANRRSIMSWLLGRNEFKELTFDSISGYKFYCVFTGCSIVYVNGYCHGFTLTGQLDSPYARGTATTTTLSSGAVSITNSSDSPDEYTYPTITFKATASNTSVTITNTTDSSSRQFQITGLNNNETVTVNCEQKTIVSSYARNLIGNFNKNWVRLKKGSNSLAVLISGSIRNGSITCPNYALVGF